MDIDPLPAVCALHTLPAAIPTFGAAQTVCLVIAVLALLVSGFISGSEIAFFSLTGQKLDELDQEAVSTKKIRRLLERPDRLLATILVANNLVNVTIVVLTNFALGPVFDGMSPVLSFILQTILLTFLILLFGEVLPKLYATNNPVGWAKSAVSGINFFMRLLWPVSSMLVSSTGIVNKMVTKKSPALSTDDLSEALDLTTVEAKDDKQMLEGILKFGETTASEIMTPRISMVGVEYDFTFDEVLKVVIDKGYSRLPVYVDTQDDIKGVLYSRDLLPYIGKPLGDFDWHSLLREPYYVPESRMIDDLLEDFRKLKIHLAIVIDEFGGTQGLVTMEDVLEEIVGDIDDEYDDDSKMYTRISEDTFNFEGRTPLTDFFRITGLDEDDFTPVTEDAETVAGMLLAIKGDFPKDKEPLVYGRCRFLVLGIAGHRITSVRVNIKPVEKE